MDNRANNGIPLTVEEAEWNVKDRSGKLVGHIEVVNYGITTPSKRYLPYEPKRSQGIMDAPIQHSIGPTGGYVSFDLALEAIWLHVRNQEGK